MDIARDGAAREPIVLRRELLALGWNDRAITRAVKRGELSRVRHGAYVDGVVWAAARDADRFALRCRAAQMQAAVPTALSHIAALPFLGAPLWGLDLSEVDLTRLDARAGRREAGVRQHRGVIRDGDLVAGSDPLVVSATRAALEVTTVAAAEPALCVVNDLLHRGLTTEQALRERYSRSIEVWPSTLQTDLVLRRADRRVETVGETRFAEFARRHHLPPMEPQYTVALPNGTSADLDFALPELGCWFEFDGKEKYTKYLRENESPADGVVREKRREDLVREVTGWECMRVVWWDLEHPVQLARRAWAFLGAVRSRSSPTA